MHLAQVLVSGCEHLLAPLAGLDRSPDQRYLVQRLNLAHVGAVQVCLGIWHVSLLRGNRLRPALNNVKVVAGRVRMPNPSDRTLYVSVWSLLRLNPSDLYLHDSASPKPGGEHQGLSGLCSRLLEIQTATELFLANPWLGSLKGHREDMRGPAVTSRQLCPST